MPKGQALTFSKCLTLLYPSLLLLLLLLCVSLSFVSLLLTDLEEMPLEQAHERSRAQTWMFNIIQIQPIERISAFCTLMTRAPAKGLTCHHYPHTLFLLACIRKGCWCPVRSWPVFYDLHRPLQLQLAFTFAALLYNVCSTGWAYNALGIDHKATVVGNSKVIIQASI